MIIKMICEVIINVIIFFIIIIIIIIIVIIIIISFIIIIIIVIIHSYHLYYDNRYPCIISSTITWQIVWWTNNWYRVTLLRSQIMYP